MAFRKNPEPAKNNPDDVRSLQDTLKGDAEAVSNAASKFFGTTVKNPAGEIDMNGTPIDDQWQEMKRRMNEMDNQFDNVDVRVMQVGPDGRLTDVTGRVKPGELRPDQIAEFRSEGVVIPRDRSGRISKEAAMDMLNNLLRADRTQPGSSTTVPLSIRRMEAALATSDEILEHWKK